MQKVTQNEKYQSEVDKKLPSKFWKALYNYHQQRNDKKIKANEGMTQFVYVVALK